MSVLQFIHFVCILGSPHDFFCIDNKALSRCVCVWFAAKTRHCKCWILMIITLVMPAPPQSAAFSRTYYHATQNFLVLEFLQFCPQLGKPFDLFYSLVIGPLQDIFVFIWSQCQFDVDQPFRVWKSHKCRGAQGNWGWVCFVPNAQFRVLQD